MHRWFEVRTRMLLFKMVEQGQGRRKGGGDSPYKQIQTRWIRVVCYDVKVHLKRVSLVRARGIELSTPVWDIRI